MALLDAISGASLADQAKDRIRSAILKGKLKPGEKVAIEQVSRELGISRTPVREALKALETDGLVNLIPHRGAIVAPLAWEEILHRYSIRAMLEGYAAELACDRGDERLIENLERNCDRLSEVAESTKGKTRVRQLVKLNAKFHALIWKGAQCAILVRMIEVLRHPPSNFAEFFWSVDEYRQMSLEHHQQIAAAFRARDSKLARSLMEKHLTSSGEHIANTAGEEGSTP